MKIKVTRTMAGLYRTLEYCNIQTSTTLDIDGVTIADLGNSDGESWADVKSRIQKAQKAVSDLVLLEFKRYHKELEELPDRYVSLPHGDHR